MCVKSTKMGKMTDMNVCIETIIKFAESRKLKGCNYCIIDTTNETQTDLLQQYEQKMSLYKIRILHHKDCQTDVRQKGGGLYDHTEKTVYIGFPHESDEFTLTRILTHEFGHYVQDVEGYNVENSDNRLLEYHNIWFYENPQNNDMLTNRRRFDKSTGFRVTYENTNHCFSKSSTVWKLLDVEFNNFYSQCKQKCKFEDNCNNKKLLYAIFQNLKCLTEQNSKELHLHLLDSFLRNF